MRARVPASSANLGPGFDALAVALACYVEVSVEPADRLEVRTTGYGAELPADASHLAARVAIDVHGHDRLRIEVHSDIPVARGLGSSAALAVAAAAAAGAADPVRLRGGRRRPSRERRRLRLRRLGRRHHRSTAGRCTAACPWIPACASWSSFPTATLATAAARAALPSTVPHADAAFNLGRMGLLIAGLADAALLVPAAGDDRLHQDARTPLFPEAPAILAGLRAAGALMSCWSGAGPSLLAVCTEDAAAAVARGRRAAPGDHGVPGEVRAPGGRPGGGHRVGLRW